VTPQMCTGAGARHFKFTATENAPSIAQTAITVCCSVGTI
jgi:hypothetical protein